MARDEIDAALNENPSLLDAAPSQLGRQLEAARRMMPEQIVGHEHLVADDCKIAADRFDRAFAHGCARAAARSNRTNSGTDSRARFQSTRRDDAPGRRSRCRHALDMTPGRQRHVVEHERAALHRGVHMLAVGAVADRARRHSVSATPVSSASATRGQHQLTIVGHDRGNFGNEKWRRIGRSRVAADDDRDVRRPRANPADERQHVVGFERMHGGDADETGRARRRCARAMLNRKSAIVTSCPRASSAAAMYSMPSGSIRKKGPRPKRSFAGTGRRRRTRISVA